VKLKEVFLPHPFYHVSGLLVTVHVLSALGGSTPAFEEYCNIWKLTVNTNKTKIVVFNKKKYKTNVVFKIVFLPHPFYHVSGLLLKIFSIWLAHALGSGMDSKNNSPGAEVSRIPSPEVVEGRS
jgi:acyl-CoA synthetase (AMP-forming)/AMP-acid ligase II